MDVARALLDDAEQYQSKAQHAAFRAKEHADNLHELKGKHAQTALVLGQAKHALGSQLAETHDSLMAHAKNNQALPGEVHQKVRSSIAAGGNRQMEKLTGFEADYEAELNLTLQEAHVALDEAEKTHAAAEASHRDKVAHAEEIEKAHRKLEEASIEKGEAINKLKTCMTQAMNFVETQIHGEDGFHVNKGELAMVEKMLFDVEVELQGAMEAHFSLQEEAMRITDAGSYLLDDVHENTLMRDPASLDLHLKAGEYEKTARKLQKKAQKMRTTQEAILLHKISIYWQHIKLGKAWNTLGELAAKAATMRVSLRMIMTCKIRRAWVTLQRCQRARNAEDISLWKSLPQFELASMRRHWRLWEEFMIERVWELDTVKVTLNKMLMRNVARAFLAWRIYADDTGAERFAVSEALRVIRTPLLAKAFRTWLDGYRTTTYLVGTALDKFVNQALSRCFNHWYRIYEEQYVYIESVSVGLAGVEFIMYHHGLRALRKAVSGDEHDRMLVDSCIRILQNRWLFQSWNKWLQYSMVGQYQMHAALGAWQRIQDLYLSETVATWVRYTDHCQMIKDSLTLAEDYFNAKVKRDSILRWMEGFATAAFQMAISVRRIRQFTLFRSWNKWKSAVDTHSMEIDRLAYYKMKSYQMSRGFGRWREISHNKTIWQAAADDLKSSLKDAGALLLSAKRQYILRNVTAEETLLKANYALEIALRDQNAAQANQDAISHTLKDRVEESYRFVQQMIETENEFGINPEHDKDELGTEMQLDAVLERAHELMRSVSQQAIQALDATTGATSRAHDVETEVEPLEDENRARIASIDRLQHAISHAIAALATSRRHPKDRSQTMDEFGIHKTHAAIHSKSAIVGVHKPPTMAAERFAQRDIETARRDIAAATDELDEALMSLEASCWGGSDDLDLQSDQLHFHNPFCTLCQTPFTMFDLHPMWPHHCRYCERVVCVDCSDTDQARIDDMLIAQEEAATAHVTYHKSEKTPYSYLQHSKNNDAQTRNHTSRAAFIHYLADIYHSKAMDSLPLGAMQASRTCVRCADKKHITFEDHSEALGKEAKQLVVAVNMLLISIGKDHDKRMMAATGSIHAIREVHRGFVKWHDDYLDRKEKEAAHAYHLHALEYMAMQSYLDNWGDWYHEINAMTEAIDNAERTFIKMQKGKYLRMWWQQHEEYMKYRVLDHVFLRMQNNVLFRAWNKWANATDACSVRAIQVHRLCQLLEVATPVLEEVKHCLVPEEFLTQAGANMARRKAELLSLQEGNLAAASECKPLQNAVNGALSFLEDLDGVRFKVTDVSLDAREQELQEILMGGMKAI